MATALPVAAAELLAPHTPSSSRCALALDVVQARAGVGPRGPVRTLARAIRGGAAPDDVQMLVDLLWPALPSAAEAVALCRAVPSDLLARTKVPRRLVERLVTDAEGDGLDADDHALAEELGDSALTRSLGASGRTVQAVRYAGWFRQRPPHTEPNIGAAVRALDNTEGVAAALRKTTLLAVASWVCAASDAVVHARVLSRLLIDSHDPKEFVGSAYRVELTAVLRDGRPTAVAAVLPALAVLGTRHRDIQQVLDKTAAVVLTGRSRRTRDRITKEIGGRRSACSRTGRAGRPKSWPEWWDDWQAAHLRTSLMSRLLARRRTAKVAD